MRAVYVQLFGRIGNNLFQIAAAASLAKENHCKSAKNDSLPARDTL
ncbi:MAG: hypothetical protein RRY07_06400 [Bacteroidaceae bacterium]